MRASAPVARLRGRPHAVALVVAPACSPLRLRRIASRSYTAAPLRRHSGFCSALGPGGGKGPQDPLKKLAQEAERHAHNLLDSLTPKEEYDLADITLIVASTLVFMWLAACLYRVYAFCYFAGGHQAVGSFMGH